MNKYFYLLPMLSLPLQALTVETRATHGVFYAGVEKQACLQILVKADASEAGKKISSLSFTTGKSSKKTDITKARLYKSNDQNHFSINAGEDTRSYELEAVPATSGSGTFSNLDVTLSAGDNYLWLAYDIASNAKGSNKIDGVCTKVRLDDGTETTPVARMGAYLEEKKATRVYGTVYPFKYRVVPYYRTKWILGWGGHSLTSSHFKNYTDFIHFGYTVNEAGDVISQWDTREYTSVEDENGEMVSVEIPGAGDKNNATALAQCKSLRGSAKCNILAGLGHIAGGLSAFYRNCNGDREAMKKVARNIAKVLIDNDYDGVDIDWEYPGDNGNSVNQDWRYHTNLLADLREELAGAGKTISIASSVWYRTPWCDVSDQVDFLNTMSYDDTGDNHASMWRFLYDCRDKCANTSGLHMPTIKIVGGLPFYTNKKGAIDDQCGWDGVVSQNPNLSASTNEAMMKVGNKAATMHTFNGPNLIKEKAKWVKDNGYGGVMIWAADTDLPLTHKMSLGKALFSVLKQTKR